MLRISKQATPQVLAYGLTRQAALSRAHELAARGLTSVVAAQAGADGSSAITLAGTKANVFYKATAPTDADASPDTLKAGDLWFDNSATGKYRPYVYDGSTWQDAHDASTIIATELGDGSVLSAKIAGGAVDTSKLADGSVSAVKIVAGAVGATQLADLGITSGKLADLAVTAGKLADGSVGATKLAGGAVDMTKLASGIRPPRVVSALPTSPFTGWAAGDTAVLTTDSKLYRFDGAAFTAAVATTDLSGTIASGQLAAGAVDMTKLASGIRPPRVVSALPTSPFTGWGSGDTAVLTTDGKLYRFNGSGFTAAVPTSDLSGTVAGTQLADGAVTTAKLAAGAVTANEIAADTITAGNIAAGAIGASELAAGAVVAGKIAAGVITANEIAADTITAGNIAAGAIGASEIAAGAVTAGKVAADAITANEIAAGSIGADELAVNSVVAGKIAAGTVGATELAANSVVAGKVAANAVDATAIAANAIVAGKIATGAVVADKIAVGALQTTNYTQDGSGNPTAGARLSNDPSDQALKVAPGNLKIGTWLFDDGNSAQFWARLKNALDNSTDGRYFYAGTTDHGGVPNVNALGVAADNWEVLANINKTLVSLQLWMKPLANTDNMDALRTVFLQWYTSAGTLVYRMQLPFTDRVHGGSFTHNTYLPLLVPGQTTYAASCLYLKFQLFGVYGGSAARWARPASATLGYEWQYDYAPGGTSSPPSGGGGGGGGGCPAPWVKVQLANGPWIPAGELYDGARVRAFDEHDPLTHRIGTVRRPRTMMKERIDIATTSGLVTSFSHDHRLVVEGRGFTRVRDLRPGNVIPRVDGGPFVVKTTRSVGIAPIVDFSVEGAHTYFADGFAHNTTKN